LGWIGEPIIIVQGDKRIFARLHSVDNQGNLLAEMDGELRRFSAAEISLRVNAEQL
jgi:biotin-(acetyl-CoA carboxylase) ligase